VYFEKDLHLEFFSRFLLMLYQIFNDEAFDFADDDR
jgi:hypothetical protein